MFKHDSTGVDPDSTILMIPEGWYTFRIYEAEERQSAKGNNMVLAKCEIIDNSNYRGETLWHYVTFLPKDSKGAGICVKFRKVIGIPYGGQDMVNALDWVGKTFQGYVIKEQYVDNKNETKMRNKISMVRSPQEAQKVAVNDESVPF